MACWLEVMRQVVQSQPQRDVIFVATSGHEIGLPGVETFLKARPGLEKGALGWVHFGANIGAVPDAPPQYAASDRDLERSAGEALREAGAASASLSPTMVGAESNLITSRGAHCLAMVGGAYALFHREADRWPSTIDVDTIARCANAFGRVAVDLATSRETVA